MDLFNHDFADMDDIDSDTLPNIPELPDDFVRIEPLPDDFVRIEPLPLPLSQDVSLSASRYLV
jgi:hypothetical protein